MSKNEKSAGLVEVRDMLKGELSKFVNIQHTLQKTSDGFNKVDANYSQYEGEIGQSRKHIDALKRKEFYENLFIYIGFVFFIACVAIVVLRRFPIHKIIALIYSALEYVIGLVIKLFSYIMASLNSPSNKTATIPGLVNNTTALTNQTYSNITQAAATIVKNATKVVKKAAKNITK
jgi:hypothetical protein